MLIPLTALIAVPFALAIPAPHLQARASPAAPTPTYTPPMINLPTVTPNPDIDSDHYRTLSGILQTVLQNGIAISNTSWELGTLSESLLEVFNPSLTPFEWDEDSFHRDVPWPMFSVALAALNNYNWTGSPNASGHPGELALYLDPATSPTKLVPQPLLDGAGALGDPNAIGGAIWILARFAERKHVRKQCGLRKAGDYAWAVGNQLQHTRMGPTSANGTISQREASFEPWSDEGGVFPPFPAYLGLAICNESLLNFGLTQWTLEASAFLDPSVNLYRHINDFDPRFWATGHGWMLTGIMRILKSIESAGQNDQFWDVIENVKAEIKQLFQALFAQLKDDGLLPDYMLTNNATLSVGDSSGTAAVVAAYYRFLDYCPGQVDDALTDRAAWAFDSVVNKIDSDGFLT